MKIGLRSRADIVNRHLPQLAGTDGVDLLTGVVAGISAPEPE